ncbi:MAG: hypothetical protein AB1847_01550 [bacterium]
MNIIIETILLGFLGGWLIIAIPVPIITGIILDYQMAHSHT